MTTTTLDREIESRLRDLDVRYTNGRRLVVAALAGSDGPRSAAELHATVGPRVPLSSLYRTLSVLGEAGVVEPHFSKKGVTRYELAEWLQGHHHHLVCINCGSIEDVALPPIHEDKVLELVQDIGTIVSFMPLNHSFEIEGRCARCA